MRKRKAALREYTEQAVRQGTIEPPWDRLVAGMVLGSEAFAQTLRRGLRANRREQPQLKALARPVEWSRIISALEEAKGESCEGSHPGHTRVTPSLLTDGSRLGFTRR